MNIRKTLSVFLVFVLVLCLVYSTAAYAAGGVVVAPTPAPADDSSSDSSAATTVTYAEAPVITKHPGGETVYTGGQATFTASASGATSVVWYLVNPLTGAKTALATGTGETAAVTIPNIPKGYNGCQVVAEFSNDYGTATTFGASIRVVERGTAEITEIVDPDASPTPTPTPTPKPTPTPTPTSFTGADTNRVPVDGGTSNGNGSANSSYVVGNSNNTTIGTTTGASMPSSDPNAIYTTESATSSGGTAKNSHIGAYILAAVAGLVIIASVTVMALYMKGKISLGSVENYLNNDNGKVDNSEDEFYNPDDFKDDHKL